MFTLRNLIFALTLCLMAWYIVGIFLNRHRAQKLIEAIRAAAPLVGEHPTIKWHGRSAFQVDIGEVHTPLTGFHLLCLLEPRDFPLAQAWNRLRGRRDQVLIQADFARAPGKAAQQEPGGYGIAGLTGVVFRPEQPHLQLTLQVAAGAEESIRRSFELARTLAPVRP
jgi:hypothetical protein